MISAMSPGPELALGLELGASIVCRGRPLGVGCEYWFISA